jgi:DNA polymerase-3 subunit alpha
MIRRAMSKKKASVMAMEREKFINGDEAEGVPGCVKNGIPADVASKIFDEMTDFAQYAFNKSHAAAYAVVAYQTAWLKTYYPVEFMAALLTSVADNNDKVREYIAECRRMNIKLLPPDINEGYPQFSVCGGDIRFGLAAIKSVGKAAVEAVVAEREHNGKFISMTQFLERMSEYVNSKCVEGLILSGAFDSFGGKRSQYMTVHKSIQNGISQTRRNNIAGQMNLFDMTATSPEELHRDLLPDIPELTDKEKLAYEKDLMGIYVSGHPLNEYESLLRDFVKQTTLDFPQTDEQIGAQGKVIDKQPVVMGGMVDSVNVKYTKKNDKMAFVTLEDINGSIEVIVFPKIFEKYAWLLQENKVVLVTGRADIDALGEKPPKVIADGFRSYDELDAASKTLWVKLAKDRDLSVHVIMHKLMDYKGLSKVIIYDEKEQKKMTVTPSYYVGVCDALIAELKMLCGEGNVIVK